MTDEEIYLEAYAVRMRLERELKSLKEAHARAKEREDYWRSRLSNPPDAFAHFATLRARKAET